ncbi:MAG: hypothetical protein Q9M08_05750, partial [Mariprofundus sp.]|nr:hypothetical protein [Mariprofundus sp.]
LSMAAIFFSVVTCKQTVRASQCLRQKASRRYPFIMDALKSSAYLRDLWTGRYGSTEYNQRFLDRFHGMF